MRRIALIGLLVAAMSVPAFGAFAFDEITPDDLDTALEARREVQRRLEDATRQYESR